MHKKVSVVVAAAVLLASIGIVAHGAPIVGAAQPGHSVTPIVSCLAGNGRVDFHIVNNTAQSVSYRIEFSTLTARQRTVAPQDFWRMPVTGRPDGLHGAIVKADGQVIFTSDLSVACDSVPPVVSAPEVQVLNACRDGNGFVSFLFSNASGATVPYIIEFDDVPNRSTSAGPWGQSIRAVSGRPDGQHDYEVRIGTQVIRRGSVAVACDGPSDTPRVLQLPVDAPFETGPREAYPQPCASTPLVNVGAIVSAIENASDGDCIVIADGTFDLGTVTLAADGAQLVAQNRWGTIFNGTTKLRVTGDSSLIQGVVFQDGDTDTGTGSEGLWIGADDVQLSHLHVHRWGSGTPDRWHVGIHLDASANRVELSDSRFSELYGIGLVQGQPFQENFVSAKGLWVHHNEFIDNPRRTGSGGETVHMGTAYSSSQGQAGPADAAYDNAMELVFEHNNIVRHQAESELVSLKSDRNLFRLNRIVDSSSSAIVVRMGSDNLVYGNWMTGNVTTPIRISGERNVYAFNYFSGAGAATILHNETLSEDGDPRLNNLYWAANSNRIVQNIFDGYRHVVRVLPTGGVYHSSPQGNTVVDNFLLGLSDDPNDADSYVDDSGFTAEADFRAANTIDGNTSLPPADLPGRWLATDDELRQLGLPIDLASALPWDASALPPPAWWSELRVADQS